MNVAPEFEDCRRIATERQRAAEVRASGGARGRAHRTLTQPAGREHRERPRTAAASISQAACVTRSAAVTSSGAAAAPAPRDARPRGSRTAMNASCARSTSAAAPSTRACHQG